MFVRIGELLVQRGVLTQRQVQRILDQQKETSRPFGDLAERLFGVDPTDVEQAWVDQYATQAQHVDVTREETDPKALKLVDRRQAWQFRVVPLRFSGGELMLATTAENLCRALRFATRCLGVPCYLVLTESPLLGQALEKHYAIGGFSAETVDSGPPTPIGILNEEAA